MPSTPRPAAALDDRPGCRGPAKCHTLLTLPYYRSVGAVPRKRHTLARGAGDDYLVEELIGQEGFSQESALLYHLTSPSAVVSITAVEGSDADADVQPDRPLTPRHLRTPELQPGGDVVLGRHLLLANHDVRVSFASADADSDLYRNAAGDELVYVHAGEATVETSFGLLEVVSGDYVVIPTGTTHRWVLRSPSVDVLVIEASGHVRFPDKHLSARGQLLEGAPFSERDVRGPSEALVVDGADVAVLVRNRGGLTRMVHRRHPFDVVGWDGCLYPHALSIHDFEPIVGMLHQPPPVHQTFAGPGFVVCSFVPRPFDFHPDAVKIPYHHANTDSDEVLFYAAGDFMSRAGSGIGVGSISYHPAGFVHGPQPGSLARSMDATETRETAVMIDTFRPSACRPRLAPSRTRRTRHRGCERWSGDGAEVLELDDAIPVVTQLEEHLLGVLRELGGHRPRRPRRASEVDGGGDHLHGVTAHQRHGDEAAGRAGLRVLDGVVGMLHRCPPHVLAVEHRAPLVQWAGGEHLVEGGHELG